MALELDFPLSPEPDLAELAAFLEPALRAADAELGVLLSAAATGLVVRECGWWYTHLCVTHSGYKMGHTKMAERKYMTTRARPVPARVMLTEGEKRELVRAAKQRDVPLSQFIREAALEKARQG